MENVTCPYCGANVEAERWKTFETCPHCGREYCVSVAASITDGASVAGLRAALDGAAEGGDYASLKAAADAVLAAIPDDFAAAFFFALAEYKLGDARRYAEFLRRADVTHAPEWERACVAMRVAENIAPECERAARAFFYSAFGSGGAKYYALAQERLARADAPHNDDRRAPCKRTVPNDCAAPQTDCKASGDENGLTPHDERTDDADATRAYDGDLSALLNALRAYADAYDLEGGAAAAAAALDEYPECAELRYWAFVFELCDAYYIDSNKAPTDIAADMRRIVGRAYDSIAPRFDGFFDSLPEGGRKLPYLCVDVGLLPSAADVERDRKKLTAERNKTVGNANREIAELNEIYGGTFESFLKGLADGMRDERIWDERKPCGCRFAKDDGDSLRYEHIWRVCKARDGRLAGIDGELKRIEREIRNDCNYFINYDKAVVGRIVDGCKRDAVGYALEALTPEVMCDELVPECAERVIEISGAATAAELTAFAYFAPCSPSVFARDTFANLYERADAGLRARLDALKEFAEAANATILSSLVTELGEKLYEELVARLKLELDLRKQTAQSKQSSIASVLPVAKKRCRLRNFFIALFAVIAAAVIGGGLAGAIIFDSGWRAVLCVIATVIACVVTIAAAALAAPRLAGYKTSVRDLERLREIYRVANADYIKAEKAVESYLPKINNFR